METHLEAGGQWLPDTLEIIEDAKRIAPDRFVGEVLPNELHEAMIVLWLNGCVDDQAGNVDSVGHVFRVGRHVVETDGYGFTRLHSYGLESLAQELIDFVAEQEADIDG